MSTLMNILNPEQFKTFSNRLHRATSAQGCTLSLQQLQHEIAKAAGARSLEAFQAQTASNTITERKLFPSEPYVLVRDVDGQMHYWSGEQQVRHLNPMTPNFFSADANYPRVMSKEQAQKALLGTDPMKRNEYRIVPLRDAIPQLFDFLTAQTAEEVQDLIKKYNVKSCRYFYCDHEDWYSEYQSGDTVLFYPEWLLHQMEQRRDDINRLYF
jgi:hypothetical protein